MRQRPIELLVMIGFLLVSSALLTGCGGGVIGTTGYEREYTPATTALAKGWKEYEAGRYASAIEQFNNVLAFKHTAAQRHDANNGLGWATIKTSGIASAAEYFKAAMDYKNDAKIGMAAYWMSTAEKANCQKAVDLLTTMGLDNVDYVWQPEHDYGVTNAEAHALMAALFRYVGQIEKAKAHAKKAEELNVPKDFPSESVVQIADWIANQEAVRR